MPAAVDGYRCRMAAQREGSTNSETSDDELDGFAIAVTREEGRWTCTPLSADALTSLEDAERELRDLRSSGAVFGLIDVDEAFFLVVRPGPGGTALAISDAACAVDYDLAADVLDALNIDLPDLSPEELEEIDPWAEGDLGLLADLALPEPVLGVIMDEFELYPDEQLGMIAQRMGFADEFAAVLDKIQS